MCTGKRQTHIRNVPSPRTAVTGIDPYNAYRHCIKNSELFQISREKSRKTEGVFLVASRGFRGEIEIPPGSFSFCHFFFWRSKRKSETAAADFRKCSYIDRLVVDHKKRCKFKATLPVRVRLIQHGLAGV